MKTTTILRAYTKATSRDFVMGRRLRQVETFRAALLARIEAGDRAREALRQVEWEADEERWYCPWCGESFEILSEPGNRYHSGNCPRQLALGLSDIADHAAGVRRMQR